jgi:type IV pilus assembly protein PilM
MALPFLDRDARSKRDHILAVDLGSRRTKAVQVHRQGEGFALTGYAMLDAPVYDKTLPSDLLAEHLQTLSKSIESKTKAVALAVSVNDSVVRPVEMPRMPLDDLRQVLKLNSKTYLQQDLSSYAFDCWVIPPSAQAAPSNGGAGMQKQRVLVAGAHQNLVNDMVEGIKQAGFSAEHVVPGLIGPVNAFELAMAEAFKSQSVALVDLGFKHSTICLFKNGEFVLNRVVAIGGDRLTTALSESMNISYAEAEGIKVGVPHEVQSTLESSLTPLGRELRASIDFFEHQEDRTVSAIFVSGGSARSEVIINALQTELMVECKTWDPMGFLKLELPPSQEAEIAQVAPELVVAVGAALAAL